MVLNTKHVISIAARHGWELFQQNPVSCVLIFSKDGKAEKVNVYYTTHTVGTIVPHPKGRKQLFRRDRTLSDLEDIFINPRVHTGAGYYKRKDFLAKLLPNNAEPPCPSDSEDSEDYDESDSSSY